MEYFDLCDSCIIKALKSPRHGIQLRLFKHNVPSAQGYQLPRSPILGDIESHSRSRSTTLTTVVVSCSAPSDRECVANSCDQ
ncbi:hypothetical protein Tco_0194782 [Tanacetum coccineum]